MPAGLAVYNDAGTVQIDDQFANMALISKTNVTVGSSPDYYRPAAIYTVVSATPPIVAIQSTHRVVLQNITRSGNTWTFTYYGGAIGNIVTCYLFNKPVYQGSGSGLVVYDASGNVTFDSRQKYARVHALLQGSGLSTQSFTYTAGRTYAAMQCKFAGYRESVYTPGINYTQDRIGMGISFSSNVATISQVEIFTSNVYYPGSSTAYNRQDWLDYSWLILDVTGY